MGVTNGSEVAPGGEDDGLNSSQKAWLGFMRAKLGDSQLSFTQAQAMSRATSGHLWEKADAAGVISYADDDGSDDPRVAEAERQSAAWLEFARQKYGDPTLTYEQATDRTLVETQLLWKTAKELGVITHLGAEGREEEARIVDADEPVRYLPGK